jgi:hypothetical protein
VPDLRLPEHLCRFYSSRPQLLARPDCTEALRITSGSIDSPGAERMSASSRDWSSGWWSGEVGIGFARKLAVKSLSMVRAIS